MEIQIRSNDDAGRRYLEANYSDRANAAGFKHRVISDKKQVIVIIEPTRETPFIALQLAAHLINGKLKAALVSNGMGAGAITVEAVK